MPQRTIYNLETLQSWASRDNATLLGEYETFYTRTLINFQCKCGEECSKKAGDIKKKMCCSDCLTMTEYEKELRERRNMLLEERNPLIRNGEWYTHPVYSDYEANNEGNVRHKTKKNNLNGYYQTNRYKLIKVMIQKKGYNRVIHRFVMECLYNVILGEEYEVDHKDANVKNNHPENLQIVTTKEHAKKTASTNPQRGKNISVDKCKEIICKFISKDDAIKALKVDIQTIDQWLKDGKDNKENKWSEQNDNNCTNIICTFVSITTAAKVLDVDRALVRFWLKQKRNKFGIWSYSVNNDDLKDREGEIWKQFPTSSEYPIKNVQCSNKGRILVENSERPIKTPGWKVNEHLCDSGNTYYSIQIGNKAYQVHQLIARTFLGPPPSSEHTVDHIDRNRSNNCVENLKWATPREQAQNMSTTKPVEIYDTLTFEVIEKYTSCSIAATKHGVSRQLIENIVLFKNGSYKLRSKNPNYKDRDLSVREANLTTDQKRERELDVLNYNLKAVRNLVKRSDSTSDLPTHIYQIIRSNGCSSYILQITFRGKNYGKQNKNIEPLLELKEAWLKEQEEFHRNNILTAFP